MTNAPATSMAELLKTRSVTTTALKKGQLIEGIISKLTPQEILIDLSAKAEAVVLEHDKNILHTLLTTLHVGDTVTAQVLSTEGDNGLPVVSLRKFIDDRRWKVVEDALTAKKKISVKVTSPVKGGYTIATDNGLNGFLPNSYATEQLITGVKIDVNIVEIHRENHRFVVSQKTSISQDEFKKVSKKVKQGDKVTVHVENVNTAALNVSVSVGEDTLPGVIFADEVSWDIEKKMPTAGEDIKALVTHVDTRNQRIVLSLKRLTADPLANVFAQYPIDTHITGKIIDVTDAGLTLDINVHGVIGSISREKLSKDHIYTVGESLSCLVIATDANARKILLAPVLTEKPLFYR